VPATDDRWDVVVVGLRDPSHGAALMAVAELAHYASLPPQDVERMLEEGEVPVLENLDRAEAERAAYELAELGALVDLRLAMTDSGVFPVFKPDAERQIGVAVGGLIDDSATPPTVGAALGLPSLEPDREPPQQPRARTTTRPPLSSASAGSKAASKPADAPRRGADFMGPPTLDDEPPPPPAPRPARPTPDPRASDAGNGRVRAATPVPGDSARSRAGESGSGSRPRASTPSPGESGSGSRPRASTPSAGESGSGSRPRAATPAPSAGARAKPAASGVESLLGDIGPAASAAPKLPQRLQRAASAAAQASVELEVDFAAAGMAPPPKRGFSGAPVPLDAAADRSASEMPRRTRAGQMGGTGASAAGRVYQGGGALEQLRGDGLAMLLVGLCVGLALALVLALQIQRSSVRDTLPPLEEELAASLSDPSGVAEGKRRDPATIEQELDGALGDLQRSFLLWWLGPGVVVGLLLSRLKDD
jgi:hypothetical protein